MCPKYMLVLLVALVLAATSLANHHPRHPTKPPSLQEQHTPHLDNYPKPPNLGKPPHVATTNELSLKEQQSTRNKSHPGHGVGMESNKNSRPKPVPTKPPTTNMLQP
ncbi:hypothetical protein E2542_SST04616 [Spatholobus suberectus]|nr:hypothetical protein E2542_SST04616 [Spatholobus suberectus]